MNLVFGRSLLISCLTLSFAPLAYAQSSQSDMTAAIERGDHDTALKIATSLYDSSMENKDHTGAGHAAYAKAQIFGLKNMPEKSAKAYKSCAEHYGKNQNAAQSLQCRYQSGLTYYTMGKLGTSRDILKQAAKELESIGQENSGLAAKVYLTLSKATLPGKFDHSKKAANSRLETVKYVEKGLIALKATGQNKTHLYSSALFLKGLTLEDAEKFSEATQNYKMAMDLSKIIPSTPEEFTKKVSTRYSIAKSYGKKGKTDKTIKTKDIHGNKVELKIKQKRNIQIPKINKNQLYDGAHVNALITLSDDGSVKNIDILESTPDAKYGESFTKSVKKWEFIPPEGVSGEDIVPFEYRITFSVKRR